MRTLGLIGGMSWESTAIYYRCLNELVRERKGGLHSAPLLLFSVDFAEVAQRQHAGDWAGAADILIDAGRRLARGGAEALMICTNTMHKLAEPVQAAADLPLIHIVDATAAAIKAAGLTRPALLGTRFTMEEPFYAGRLRERHGLEPVTPDEAGRAMVHRVIYDELCRGEVNPRSKEAYRRLIEDLARQGADCLILGCTEIGMLIGQADVPLPVFDSTRLHAQAGIDFALSGPALS